VDIRFIYSDACPAIGHTNRVASHVELGTQFGVPSRTDTKLNLAVWARHQLQIKFGVSALFGCEEKRMKG
jgi:hypothetical protein